MKSFILFVSFVLLWTNSNASPDSRIVNGESANHLPSYAYIKPGGILSEIFGGGHIISDLHVITSASLISGYSEWHIGIGFNRIFIHFNLTSFAAVAHTDYNAFNGINDIGIIFLPSRLDFGSPNIQPIQLPEFSTETPFANEEGKIYGYGSVSGSMQVLPDTLHMTYQRVVSNTTCSTDYPGVNMSLMFCAFDNSISNACTGDAGGGFITSTRGQSILSGIILNRNLCQLVISNSYIRVSAYREWIRTTAQV